MTVAPPSTPEPRSRFWLWIGLGVGGVLAASIATLIFVVAPSLYNSLNGDGTGSVSFDSGSDVPLDACSECLSREDALRLTPADADLALFEGMRAIDSEHELVSTSIGEWADDAESRFAEASGSPAQCDFLLSTASISPTSPSTPSRDDIVVDLGTYESASAHLSMTARIFWSTIYSDRFASSLISPIRQCAVVDYVTDGETHTVVVTRLDLEPTPGVAAEGWVETSAEGPRFVADLQYSTVVVRTVLEGEGATVGDFYEFVAQLAEKMVDLEPLSLSKADPGAEGECTGTCFSIESASELTATSADLEAFRVDYISGVTGSPLLVGIYDDRAIRTYKDGAGEPDQCAFVMSEAPVSPTSPGPDLAARQLPATQVGDYGSDEISLMQVVRAFESESAASAYVESIATGLADCPHYQLGDPVDPYETDVVVYSPDVQSTVAAVGWTETGQGYDFSAVDLQRGNLVIRTIYSRPSDSAAGQDSFNDLVALTAKRLASLTP